MSMAAVVRKVAICSATSRAARVGIRNLMSSASAPTTIGTPKDVSDVYELFRSAGIVQGYTEANGQVTMIQDGLKFLVQRDKDGHMYADVGGTFLYFQRQEASYCFSEASSFCKGNWSTRLKDFCNTTEQEENKQEHRQEFARAAGNT